MRKVKKQCILYHHHKLFGSDGFCKASLKTLHAINKSADGPCHLKLNPSGRILGYTFKLKLSEGYNCLFDSGRSFHGKTHRIEMHLIRYFLAGLKGQ